MTGRFERLSKDWRRLKETTGPRWPNVPAARRRANDVPPKAPTPLAPLVGNMWMPVWAVRPGSYTALRGVALTMPLWTLLHSRNQDFFKPCYASREDLGMTLGIGRAKVSR